MKRKRKGGRYPATVVGVFYGEEDHGWLTAWVRLDHSGGEQGFGGVVLDERTGPEFKRQVVQLFGWPCKEMPETPGAAWEKLVGRECFALCCWGVMNARIDGIEVDGKRFLINRFRREMWPETVILSEYEAEQESILSEMAHLSRRMGEETERLRNLSEEYCDWEKFP